MHTSRQNLFILLLLALCPTWACAPREALAYRHPELPAAEAKLAAVRMKFLAVNVGLSGSAAETRQSSDDTYILNLHWARPRVTVTEAARALETAQRELIRLRRDGITQALTAHAALWDAQAGGKAAALRAAAAGLHAEESIRRQALGETSALDAETARLDQEEAALRQRRTAKALATAKADADRYHLTGDADPTPLTFLLPKAAVEDSLACREARWDEKLALARLTQTRKELAPALGVDLTYLSTNLLLQGTISTRGPGVDATFRHPGADTIFIPSSDNSFTIPDQGWTQSLRLEIPLDLGALAETRAARADVRVAQVRLEESRKTAAVRLEQAKAEVEATAEEMRLAQARMALDVRRVLAAQAREKAGAASQLAVLDEQARQAEDESRLARAWKDYLTATAAYLDLVDGSWEEAR